MTTEPHRWAVAIPVEVLVQKNEDGQFACKLPATVQIHSEGELFPFALDSVKCVNCGQQVEQAFTTECAP